jgi:N6-adenosine-specific RNA methylase IME4
MTAWPFDDLAPLSCDVIVADPPWDFENYSEAGTAKGADPHYEVMALDAITALPVGQLARGDCLLLLWTCGWAMATGQAQAVARAWGFKPQSEMIWRKLTADGKPRMGTGWGSNLLLQNCEGLRCSSRSYYKSTSSPIPWRSRGKGQCRHRW